MLQRSKHPIHTSYSNNTISINTFKWCSAIPNQWISLNVFVQARIIFRFNHCYFCPVHSTWTWTINSFKYFESLSSKPYPTTMISYQATTTDIIDIFSYVQFYPDLVLIQLIPVHNIQRAHHLADFHLSCGTSANLLVGKYI
jgi:hypothetical protein